MTGCADDDPRIVRVSDVGVEALTSVLSCYGLCINEVENGGPIPGSFWGAPEAGLIRHDLFIREDTPVHSVMHEACHYICMPAVRRAHVHTNAGGIQAEEDATCYLQILLADQIRGFSRQQMFKDMNLWGYHFIKGSAEAWFYEDASDVKAWLLDRNLLPEGSVS